jgi:hypothetical protein
MPANVEEDEDEYDGVCMTCGDETCDHNCGGTL